MRCDSLEARLPQRQSDKSLGLVLWGDQPAMTVVVCPSMGDAIGLSHFRHVRHAHMQLIDKLLDDKSLDVDNKFLEWLNGLL